MTEPVYEYVKGKGWLVIPGLVLTFRDGRAAIIQFRIPKPDEYYGTVDKGSDIGMRFP